MMKQVKIRIPMRVLSLLLGLFLSVGAFAQSNTVTGQVKDATGEPVIGATVRIDGQNGGAVELSDIRFTDTDFTEHGFAAVSSEVTGIGAVAKGVSESTWYSLDGQKTAQPTKGVFVRDGKKMVVK